jgi:LysB family phage lysis regulatory protein
LKKTCSAISRTPASESRALPGFFASTVTHQFQLLADKLAEQTTALLRHRQHRIEELKRENEDLRRWADTPLPADIIRLRERPALAGGAAFREWLSQSDAVQPAPVSAAH